jgi:glycine C-acetyltransferase/8-amino-7-oxononanoate synthase
MKKRTSATRKVANRIGQVSGLAAPLEHLDANHVLVKGKSLTYFGGCDYLRLSWHRSVRAAVAAGMERWGLNVAASRKTTGNHVLYEELEKALARFFRSEHALVVSSGYVTGLVVGQALAGEFTHVLVDERAHVCLHDAARFLNCPIRLFRHRNPEDLARLLQRCGRKGRPMVMTDGMFAHDGSAAPLRAYLNLLPAQGWLLVDDAHGAGVLGRSGRGTLELEGVSRDRVVQTLTLSKAFGIYGGVILGPERFYQKFIKHSGLVAGNTPLPLPWAAGALRSLELYRDHPGWLQRLRKNTIEIKESLRPLGRLELDTPGPIVFWPIRRVGHEQTLSRALRRAGIYPSYLRYPGGPASGYFRFAVSSKHTREQLNRLVDVLREDAGLSLQFVA